VELNQRTTKCIDLGTYYRRIIVQNTYLRIVAFKLWYNCAGCLRFHPSARASAERCSGTESEYCTYDPFSNERARVVDLRFALRVLITEVELFSERGPLSLVRSN